jgi:hypothetical protein
MTTTMTFTEFNRHRSKVMKAARRGEDVVVRSGREGGDGDAVLITRLGKTMSSLARGIADGTIRAPLKSLDAPFVTAETDPDRSLAALAEFEAERR